MLRLIEDAALPAAANMARDEACLLAGPSHALRFYAWQPHAVSLGWFQKLADFADLPPGTPMVRRATGGGAIHHAVELTFSLALDQRLLPVDVDASYALLHDAVLAALAAVRVRAERLQSGPAAAARAHHRWCFAVPGRHDLVDGKGRKLCGSAQRRVRTEHGPRVLHHGSLVLERPELTPFVAAVADQAPTDCAPALQREVALAFARTLGLALLPDALRPEERELALRIERERYGDPAHTAAR